MPSLGTFCCTAAAAISITIATSTGAMAAGDSDFEADAEASNDTVSTWVIADQAGSEVAGYSSGSGGSTWVCSYYAITAVPGSTETSTVDWSEPIWQPPTDLYSALVCRLDGEIVHSEVLFFDPGDPLAGMGGAERARDQALASLVLPEPTIELSPPRDAEHLVGLPSWYSVATPWTTDDESASLGGVTSTVTATPVAVSWDPGDGSDVIVCSGPGDAWVAGEDPTCGHTYTDSGTFTLTAMIEWDVAWQATTGVGGPLAPLTTTSTWPVTVRQAQAVLGG